MADVVGIDAAGPLGWVAVALRDARLLSMSIHPTLASVRQSFADAQVLAIDVPIGHEDPQGLRDQGRRACDVAARAFLAPARRSSIFAVPPPAVLDVGDHATAIALCRSRSWHAPSAQLWAIRPRILEARAIAADARWREVHPEVSFQALKALLGGPPALEHPKSSLAGRQERLGLLHAARLRPERSMGGIGRASPEDVLDATICAWTAMRIHHGDAVCLPDPAPDDPATRRPVQISY